MNKPLILSKLENLKDHFENGKISVDFHSMLWNWSRNGFEPKV